MNKRLAIVIAFLIQIFPVTVLLLWISASNEYASQQESVVQFYSYFPENLQGPLLTGICALICGLSIALSLHGTTIKGTFWKYVSLITATTGSLMLLLFLFWLM